ncbi:hypothetical protein CKO38_05325 [Rhodospirillum rubrum]|uniref:hypothetical protein n=1 Tax=Rhodospirillum rubrum TaxID=1085 RepID=UPI0019031323|nr:hypothetical protein [Rhodospirillum rubrum]MBK1664926.1 hypothetical protein [Rhodospirillum rubrum]MBK1676103.1 hypothetical protein [Rhodospirillum rubrum]
MRYLGGTKGSGLLTCDGEDIGRATYDFESFLKEPGGISRSGEITLAAEALKEVFGRKGVQLLTDEGSLMTLRFSEKKLPPESDVAHVDVTDEVPPPTLPKRA